MPLGDQELAEVFEKTLELANQGNLEGAVSELDKALASDDTVSDLWRLRGQLLFGLGEFDQAIASIRKYLALEPQDFGGYSFLGSALKDLGRFDESEEAHLHAISIKPDEGLCWYNLGVLYEIVDVEKARGAYEKTVELDPESSDAWYNLGNVYKQLNDDVGAVRAVKNALKYNPGDPDAWDNLAMFLYDLGQYKEAEEAGRKAVEIDPHHPNARGRLASILMALGDHEGAKEQLREATLNNPDSATDFFNLALISERTGDMVEATRAYLIAEELGIADKRPQPKSIRTTNCKKYNHPEFVIHFEDPIDEEWMKWLSDIFEQQVAEGVVYKPEETVQMGWMFVTLKMDGDHLCPCEPHFIDMPIKWVNRVTKSMLHMLSQNFVLESVGLENMSDMPSIMQTAIVCNRFGEEHTSFYLQRDLPSEENPIDSGWVILCAFDDCDHSSPDSIHLESLYECATKNGDIIKYLALPAGSTVFETGNPEDFEISFHGKVLQLKPGSILAERLARRQPIA